MIVEFANGGAILSTGAIYLSWDVRLGSFILGVVFLMLYYKKYHAMRDLYDRRCCDLVGCLPVVFCKKEQSPLTSIPIEEEITKQLITTEFYGFGDEEEVDFGGVKRSFSAKNMATQTSLLEKPPENEEPNATKNEEKSEKKLFEIT